MGLTIWIVGLLIFGAILFMGDRIAEAIEQLKPPKEE